jgi:branched-chain amino acid transport system substrate-binding protein
VKAYFEWLNKNGGIDGKKVELISKDDGGDPAQNAALARDLVEVEGVVAMVGEATQGSSGGGAGYLEQKGIPSIGGWGNGEEWFGQYDNMFVIVSSQGETSCAPWLTGMAVERDVERPAFFGLDIPIGITDIQCHLSGWEKLGKDAPVTSPDYSAIDQADFRPAVKKALDADADALINNMAVGGTQRLITAAEQSGFEGEYIGGGAVGAALISGLSPALKQSLNGRLFGPSFTTPVTGDAAADFRDTIAEKYSTDPFALAGWASGVMVADAIEAVGADSGKIMDYMYDLPEGYDAQGLLGPLSYERGNLGPAKCTQMQVFDGETMVPADESGEFICADLIDPTEYTKFWK